MSNTTGGGEAPSAPTNMTIYINNLNEKIKLEVRSIRSKMSCWFRFTQCGIFIKQNLCELSVELILRTPSSQQSFLFHHNEGPMRSQTEPKPLSFLQRQAPLRQPRFWLCSIFPTSGLHSGQPVTTWYKRSLSSSFDLSYFVYHFNYLHVPLFTVLQ
ncbi:U1 small nuclear ribonucleoprotein A [Platanthera guangdongensis]|uniref:U1 small nuclear ribonucleoprotein A n=1 Tax=Platanthera guangdongensis TaxID=2320717 RepID=A0ABR2M6Z0_9ASPA